MADYAQLTAEPTDIQSDFSLTSGNSYRIQSSKYNEADVLLWDESNPPGGSTGYTLEPGESLVVSITGTEFHAWCFHLDNSKRFGQIVIFDA